MEVLIIAVAVGAVLAVVVWTLVRTPGRGGPPRGGGAAPPDAGTVEHVIDVPSGDAGSAAVQRLVADVAARSFAASPDVDEVVVRNRDGALLGRVSRRPDSRERSDLPPDLSVHHRPSGRPPSAGTGRRAARPPAEPITDLDREPPGRALTDRFDLPERVLAAVRDADDPADVLRAVLVAGGHEPRTDGRTLTVGDTAFVVVSAPGGRSLSSDDLAGAFHRFQSTGAARGFVLLFGYADPQDIRRREALAPNIEYLGRDAIQRMADAAALGADPVAFASAPPTAS